MKILVVEDDRKVAGFIELGLREEGYAVIHDAVANDVPLLAICLGMQMLTEGSDEVPGLRGLGVIPGRCAAMTDAPRRRRRETRRPHERRYPHHPKRSRERSPCSKRR